MVHAIGLFNAIINSNIYCMRSSSPPPPSSYVRIYANMNAFEENELFKVTNSRKLDYYILPICLIYFYYIIKLEQMKC